MATSPNQSKMNKIIITISDLQTQVLVYADNLVSSSELMI